MNTQGKVWMVRVGSHMCGPYETEAIHSLILDQRISEIDEIALPCQGWQFIRDKTEFIITLEKLKSSSFSRSGTKATSTGTENITQLTSSDRTEELTFSRTMDTKTAPLVEFEREVLQGQRPTDAARMKELKLSTVKPKKTKLTLILGIITILVGAYFLKSLVTDKGAWSPFSKNALGSFSISWASGDYTRAFKQMLSDKKIISKNRTKHAALLLLKDKGVSRAMQTLELSKNKSSAEWKNLRGLIELYQGRFDSAESYFLSALKEKENYIPSLVNLGLLKREQRDWLNARYYFESAFSNSDESGEDEEISFYLIESWLRQVIQTSDSVGFSKVEAFLKNQMVGNSTYMHELKSLEMWIYTFTQNWKVKESDILSEFLKLDPYILLERKRSPFVYEMKKGGFSDLCDDLSVKLKASELKKSSLAICYLMNKQYKVAQSLLVASPMNEYEKTTASFLLRIRNQASKADEYLVQALESVQNKSIVKFYLQARFCFEKGDMKCAAEYWRKGLDFDSNAYSAYTGLARSYFEVGDKVRAQTFMERAEGFTNSYGPLIELQALMKDK